MAILWDIAMTAGEFQGNGRDIAHPAWMACHYSSSSAGLSNLPDDFPTGATVMMNDRFPPQGHDPRLICRQLCALAEELQCRAIILDFQRPNIAENAAIARKIADALPCPVGISEQYAKSLSCPVFLSPVPCHVPPETHLAPWNGREIWLEAALDGACISVTEAGASICPWLPEGEWDNSHADHGLHCHYEIQVYPSEIRFFLRRTLEDLRNLLTEAAKWGVTRGIGLYQELGNALENWE